MKAYQPIVDEMQTRLGLTVPAEYESDKVEDSIAVIAQEKSQRIQAAKDAVVSAAELVESWEMPSVQHVGPELYGDLKILYEAVEDLRKVEAA